MLTARRWHPCGSQGGDATAGPGLGQRGANGRSGLASPVLARTKTSLLVGEKVPFVFPVLGAVQWSPGRRPRQAWWPVWRRGFPFSSHQMS